MSKEITKADERELHAMARRINEREEAIQQLRKTAFGAVGSMLSEAILQGQELINVRDKMKGFFVAWVAANCPRVKQAQAYRYIKLAEGLSRGINLTEAGSIRAALLLCDKDPAASEEKLQKEWPAYIEGLYRIGKWMGFVKENPIAQWPEEGKEKARADLLPAVAQLWPDKFTA